MKWINAWYPVILDRSILPWVPQLAERGNGQFCVSFDFDPALVADICYHGYMPMGDVVDDIPLLLIKSHRTRCVLDFQNLRISRKLKRYARSLTLHINHDFHSCLQRIVEHHPETWLIEPLCTAIKQLHQHPTSGVSFHSIEVYHGQALIAGEIGYTTGPIYSSLAGFHTQNGSGSVQLALLGGVLAESQFMFWDLGMEMAYKTGLGAQVVGRRAFLSRWQDSRDRPTPNWFVQELDSQEIAARLKRTPKP